MLELFQKPECEDLRANMGAAAHLIHGSSDGRFTVTYAVQPEMREQIEGVHFRSADVNAMLRRYDPATLKYGYNTLPDGEEIFYIPNPALGLWIDRERFAREGGALLISNHIAYADALVIQSATQRPIRQTAVEAGTSFGSTRRASAVRTS